MSVLNAVRTGLSGLNAQATRLAGISNNIANSATVGYKRVDTTFESLVLEGGGGGSYSTAGTSAVNRLEISKVGQVQRTGQDTDIAVNGAGMMVVNERADGSGKFLVTRAGSFRPDQYGNLVNAAGYFLQGVQLASDGTPMGNLGDNNIDSMNTVNVANVSVGSSPTTEMRFWANLPADLTNYASPPPDPVQTSVEYYDPLGGTRTMTFKYTPTLPATASDPATNTWTMEIFDSASQTPNVPVGRATMVFNSTGQNAGTVASVTPIDANGTTTGTVLGTYDEVYGTFTVPTGLGDPMPITIGVPNSIEGITQLYGEYVPTRIEKNGSTFGLLERVNIEENGDVLATFSNGKSRPIYRLKLAVFPSPDSLNPVRGDAYEISNAAGVPRLLDPGEGAAGAVSGGALENSNVDISTELTNLIETQRAYSSNATVIRAADEMLDEATRLKR